MSKEIMSEFILLLHGYGKDGWSIWCLDLDIEMRARQILYEKLFREHIQDIKTWIIKLELDICRVDMTTPNRLRVGISHGDVVWRWGVYYKVFNLDCLCFYLQLEQPPECPIFLFLPSSYPSCTLSIMFLVVPI